jgi:hypothetical protein
MKTHLFTYGSDKRFSFDFSTDEGIERLTIFLNDVVICLCKRVDFLEYYFEEIKQHASTLLKEMNDFNKSENSNFKTDNNEKFINKLKIKYVNNIKFPLQLLEKETYFTVNSNRYDLVSPTKHWTAYHQAKKHDFISYDLYLALVKSMEDFMMRLTPPANYKDKKTTVKKFIESMDVNLGTYVYKINDLQHGITKFSNDEAIRLSNLSLSKNIKIQLIIMLINYFNHYQ